MDAKDMNEPGLFHDLSLEARDRNGFVRFEHIFKLLCRKVDALQQEVEKLKNKKPPIDPRNVRFR